ncbi:MAG: alkaline phosphatase family protein [Methanosarcinales archaeon]
MSRVILLGIDGADWNYILKFRLPNLFRVMSRGLYCDLESTFPPLTPTAWTSMMTGVHPGIHHIYGFGKPKKKRTGLHTLRGYDYDLISRLDCGFPALWDLVDDSVFLNVPASYPPKEIKNGVMISGLLSPKKEDAFADKGLMEDIEGFLGSEYEICADRGPFVPDKMRVLEKRWKVIEFLMDRFPDAQFQMYVVTQVDSICHFNPQDEYVYPAYAYCDKQLGRLVDRLEPDDVLIIASDHGHTLVNNLFAMNTFLQKGGFVELEGTSSSVNYERTWAYYPIFYSTEFPAIRLNIRGRDLHGIVDPQDVSSLKSKIITWLESSKWIEWAYDGSSYYYDSRWKDAGDPPDIVFRIRDDTKIAARESPAMVWKIPAISKHRDRGIFVMFSKNMKVKERLLLANIWDVAPTVLDILGIKHPKEEFLTGRSLLEGVEL